MPKRLEVEVVVVMEIEKERWRDDVFLYCGCEFVPAESGRS